MAVRQRQVGNDIFRTVLRVVPTVIGGYYGGVSGALGGWQLGSGIANAAMPTATGYKTYKSIADADPLASYKTDRINNREISSMSRISMPTGLEKGLGYADIGVSAASTVYSTTKTAGAGKTKEQRLEARQQRIDNRADRREMRVGRSNEKFYDQINRDIDSGMFDEPSDTDNPLGVFNSPLQDMDPAKYGYTQPETPLTQNKQQGLNPQQIANPSVLQNDNMFQPNYNMYQMNNFNTQLATFRKSLKPDLDMYKINRDEPINKMRSRIV